MMSVRQSSTLWLNLPKLYGCRDTFFAWTWFPWATVCDWKVRHGGFFLFLFLPLTVKQCWLSMPVSLVALVKTSQHPICHVRHLHYICHICHTHTSYLTQMSHANLCERNLCEHSEPERWSAGRGAGGRGPVSPTHTRSRRSTGRAGPPPWPRTSSPRSPAADRRSRISSLELAYVTQLNSKKEKNNKMKK